MERSDSLADLMSKFADIVDAAIAAIRVKITILLHVKALAPYRSLDRGGLSRPASSVSHAAATVTIFNSRLSVLHISRSLANVAQDNVKLFEPLEARYLKRGENEPGSDRLD